MGQLRVDVRPMHTREPLSVCCIEPQVMQPCLGHGGLPWVLALIRPGAAAASVLSR